MRKTLLCTLPLLALAACHANVDISDTDGNSSGGDNVHVSMGDATGNSAAGANRVSIDVPGFSANVSLPDINLSGHMDLDGIKVAPNSKVTGLDASSDDKDGDKGGTAKFTFTNSDSPGAVIDYYKRAASDAGYGDIVVGNGALTAKKGDKSFAVNVTPQGAGSQGVITVSGKD